MTSKKNADQIGEKICKEIWGFVPCREVKPVHFANGFFRALCGVTGSPDTLHMAAGAFLSGKSKTTTQSLIQEAQSSFSSKNPDDDDVKELRAALDLILSQDGAVFPSKSNYSFTSTHWRHTSSDASDGRTGKFMVAVLDDIGYGDVVQGLREVLNQDDDIYRLTVPLLKSDIQMTQQVKLELSSTLKNDSNMLKILAERFKHLMQHQNVIDKADFLHKVVMLSCFGLCLHLFNSDEPSRKTRTPLLLCDNNPPLSVKDASRDTLQLAKNNMVKAFESGLLNAVEKRLAVSQRDIVGLNEWLNTVLVIPYKSKSKNHDLASKLFEQYKQKLKHFQGGGLDLVNAFARAATPALFTMMGSKNVTPHRFIDSLGKRSGFIGPLRGSGALYFRASPQFLDVLVMTLLKPNEEITANEFWERAAKHYGVVVGGRGLRDIEYLREYDVTNASVTSLSSNAVSLHQRLEQLGYANTYADGVTLIHTRE